MTVKTDIDKWFKDEEAVKDLVNGVILIKRSGIVSLLKQIGKPRQTNDQEAAAAQCNYSAGWNDALDELMNFFESRVGAQSKAMQMEFK